MIDLLQAVRKMDKDKVNQVCQSTLMEKVRERSQMERKQHVVNIEGDFYGRLL